MRAIFIDGEDVLFRDVREPIKFMKVAKKRVPYLARRITGEKSEPVDYIEYELCGVTPKGVAVYELLEGNES